MDFVDKLRNIPAVACTRNIEDTNYIMVGAVAREAADEIERLRKQLAANNPLLDEAADKIDELEAKLKFAEITLEEIRNEDANKTINYYCDETLSVIRGK